MKSIVRFTDETVVFFKDLPDGTAIRVINRIPEGFRKTKYLSEGQKVFSNGKVFISPDVTGHIGGRWKAATKVEYLKNNTTRIGTFDENLYKIGNKNLVMNKIEHIDSLKSIIDGRNQFFEELGEGKFNRKLFHSYTKTILELSKLHLDDDERCKCIIMIWQINHRIQDSLISHFDTRDIYRIDNIEDDDRTQLKNILYYSAVRFSYNLNLDIEDVVIGGWK